MDRANREIERYRHIVCRCRSYRKIWIVRCVCVYYICIRVCGCVEIDNRYFFKIDVDMDTNSIHRCRYLICPPSHASMLTYGCEESLRSDPFMWNLLDHRHFGMGVGLSIPHILTCNLISGHLWHPYHHCLGYRKFATVLKAQKAESCE